MGAQRKGSETNWITAHQWPSPDTWPSFPGSLSDLVWGRHERLNGQIAGSMNRHTEMGRRGHLPWRAADLPRKKEKDLSWWITVSFSRRRNATSTSTKTPPPCNPSTAEVSGGLSHKVYAVTVNHSPTTPLRGARPRMDGWMGRSVRAERSDADTKLLLIKEAGATKPRVSVTLIWTTGLFPAKTVLQRRSLWRVKDLH